MEQFEKNGNVGYCSSCKKHVIDFTKYSDREIMEFFKKNNGNTCGQLRENQLKTYEIEKQRDTTNKIAAVIAAGVLTLSQVPDVNAQSKFTFSGHIIDATDTMAMPGTNVAVKNTTAKTTTNIDGNFNLSYEGNDKEITLVFSFIGMETLEK